MHFKKLFNILIRVLYYNVANYSVW